MSLCVYELLSLFHLVQKLKMYFLVKVRKFFNLRDADSLAFCTFAPE